jgi:hypothetical protein
MMLSVSSAFLDISKKPLQYSLFDGKVDAIGLFYDFGPFSQMFKVHLDHQKTDSVSYKHSGMRNPAYSTRD